MDLRLERNSEWNEIGTESDRNGQERDRRSDRKESQIKAVFDQTGVGIGMELRPERIQNGTRPEPERLQTGTRLGLGLIAVPERNSDLALRNILTA